MANNLSDNVVLLDLVSGKVLQKFDLSTNDLVPSSFPYMFVVMRDGRHAWCSLWNAHRWRSLTLPVAKSFVGLDLRSRKIGMAPGSHPTALLLSPDEKTLYVALSNADVVAQYRPKKVS